MTPSEPAQCQGCQSLFAPVVLTEEGYCPKCHAAKNEHFRLQKRRKKSRPGESYEAPEKYQKMLEVSNQDAEQKAQAQKRQMEELGQLQREHEDRVERVKAAQPEFEARYSDAIEDAQAQTDEAAEQKRLAQKVLAQRELARRHLIPYIMYTTPNYLPGWVHKDVCRRLEKFSREVAEGKSPRLMLTMPPRSGKSTLGTQKFPAWHLGKYPDHEFIVASYSASLANKFSKMTRAIMRTKEQQQIFPDCRLDEDDASVEGWSTTRSGAFFPTGVGGPATGRGAHCVPMWSTIKTPSGNKTFEELLNNRKEEQYVLSYDGTNTVRKKINAFITRTSDHYYRIETATGTLEATGEHPVCVGFEGAKPVFRRVDDLRVGERIVTVDPENPAPDEALRAMSDVRNYYNEAPSQVPSSKKGMRKSDAHLLQRMLRAIPNARPPTGAGVRRVFCDLLRGAGFGGAEKEKRTSYVLLFWRLLWGLPFSYIRRGEPPSLHASPAAMCGVRGGLHAKQIRGGTPGQPLLQPRLLCGLADWSAYEPGQKFAWGSILPTRVQGAEKETVTSKLCRVWQAGRRPTSPGRGQGKQRPRESSASMPGVPHEAPPAHTFSVIKSIDRVEGDVTVGDLEVEGTHSFLTGASNLLLNCLIVDDPVKNAEEAESETVRESIVDWYTSTAYTRLSPGGGVLLIQTRWHDADLAGWLQALSDNDEGDHFEVINYPAIAEKDEKYRKKGEALHPERYPLESLERIKKAVGPRVWQALYQQNPVPDSGDYFKREDLRWYHENERPALEDLAIYAAADFAIGQKESNDSTVIYVVGIDRDMRLWVLDRYKGHWGTYEIIKQLCLMYRTWKPEITGGEKGHIEMAISPVLNQEKHKPEYNAGGLFMKPINPGRRDKVARARPFQALVESHQVYFPSDAPWIPDMLQEVLRFPLGKHDDDVDSLAYIGQLISMFSPKPLPRAERKASWRDKLDNYVGGSGKGSSAMGA